MSKISALEVVLIKPTGYCPDPKGNGYTAKHKVGTMANSTIGELTALIPSSINNIPIRVVRRLDEYVITDRKLTYLKELHAPSNKSVQKIVMICGVQTWQFQRAMDLAAYAHSHGSLVILGGPHFLTNNVDNLYGRGINFALSEGQLIMGQILEDAINEGQLQNFYGKDQRWAKVIESGLVEPPEFKNHGFYMVGYTPAAGCPFTCTFCTVWEAFGNLVRVRPFDKVIANLKLFEQRGVQILMFTSDNFNKIPGVKDLLRQMIEENIRIPFFVQCDTQLSEDEELVQLMALANCTQVFIGLETLNEDNLDEVHKVHNKGTHKQNTFEKTQKLLNLLRKYKINSHLSTIICFPKDKLINFNEHIDAVKTLNPNIASFYPLTPVPGTIDFARYMKNGLIREKNMDLYDCTHNVWNHPYFSPQMIEDLLYRAYREFYTFKHLVSHAKDIYNRSKPGIAEDIAISTMYHLYSKYSSYVRSHPMRGGFYNVAIDSAKDYRHLRRQYYGDLLDENYLFPFPTKREISEQEKAQNKEIKEERRRKSLPVIVQP